MDSRVPLRILCLDGGGVRGLSSLYILKELMLQIRRNRQPGGRQEPPRHLRPCDSFDLICGTGTGGILAIMLGRLQYDIESAITAYISLATAVFETCSSEECALFDAGALEAEMLKVIRASPDGSMEDAVFEDPRVVMDTGNCRTFVLASRLEGLGKAAVRMRSYATDDGDPFPAQIWQVARATSATPTHFLPIDLNGIRFGDGRMGWNNPTMEAINEANYVWPGRPIACVVSVGTGLEDAIQLTTESKVSSISGVMGYLFRSLTPKQAFNYAVAQYCVSCVTSCERIHGQILSNLAKFGIDSPRQYVRLNVPQGMARIGPQEWKKFHTIAAMTADYMDDVDVRELKREVADRLSSPQYYSVSASASASASVPNRRPRGRAEYKTSHWQIESDNNPVTYPATVVNLHDGEHSNALVRQQIINPRQQNGSLKGEYSESSSDENGARGKGEMKRSKIEVKSTTRQVSSAANRGLSRHSPATRSPSPTVDIYPSLNKCVTGQSKAARHDGSNDDESQRFSGFLNSVERSATVLCCEYPDCRPMGALQKDYLRDHYVTYHDEYLIKPSLVMSPAGSMMCSGSLRCFLCLWKFPEENQGKTCENCQRFEPTTNVAMPDFPDSNDLEEDSLASDEPSGSYPKNEAEGSTHPQQSFWTPPEIPQHWTSYTPSTRGQMNTTTSYSHTRSLSSYRSPHTMPASVRKAREEYRRQRFYHENS